ncbi:MAG: hypothetical protein DWQ04_08840 [Chloroflexi bacterium]|nr:MAG: hypothetical protein DWQ04_08840 [Chloroflexota bacterium]
MNNKDLQKKLVEDLGSMEAADSLFPVAAMLRELPAPQPTEKDTAQLLAALENEMLQVFPTGGNLWMAKVQWVYWLLRAQMRVVRTEIWLGSAFVMALGVLVTLATDLQALPFVLIAPMVAAVGVTFLYGPANDPALEIELATAVSPRMLLLARMAVLFGIDLGLGIAGSILLAGLHSQISLWPLINTWLAPMAFLSAFAFFFSLISFEPLLGIMLSLILWGIQSMRQFDAFFRLPTAIPNLLLAQWQPWLWLSAIVLGGTAVLLVGREEWVIGNR